ncbi:MAG: hypothetical protein KAW49_06660, partial [Anaerolineae bacterium]|nr:hypothetical protein [Anaerolineae bacterium]
ESGAPEGAENSGPAASAMPNGCGMNCDSFSSHSSRFMANHSLCVINPGGGTSATSCGFRRAAQSFAGVSILPQTALFVCQGKQTVDVG